MLAKVIRGPRVQGAPQSGTLRVAYPVRYVDAGGRSSISEYRAVWDQATGTWKDAATNGDFYIIAAGTGDPTPPKIQLIETFQYPGETRTQAFEVFAIVNTLANEFDYAAVDIGGGFVTTVPLSLQQIEAANNAAQAIARGGLLQAPNKITIGPSFIVPAAATPVAVSGITPGNIANVGAAIPVTAPFATGDIPGIVILTDANGNGTFTRKTAGAAQTIDAGASLFIGSIDGNLSPRVTGVEIGKADKRFPAKPAKIVNGFKTRYGKKAGVFSSDRFVLGGAAFAGTAHTSSYVHHDTWAALTGEPNAIKVEGKALSAATYAPQLGVTALLVDLTDLGVVPSDAAPPTVTVRIAIRKDSLVNLSAAAINTTSLQIWLALRYGAGNAGTPGYLIASEIYWVNTSAQAFNNGAAYGGVTLNAAPTITDDGVFVIVTRSIKVPATLSGQPLNSLKIHMVARPTDAAQPASFEVAAITVIPGAAINPVSQPYYNTPEDQVQPFITKADLDPSLADQFGAVAFTVSPATSDAITMASNSRQAGYYNLKGKNVLNVLSDLTGWRFNNYSVSGYSALDMTLEVRNNAKLFHASRGIQDFKSTYGLALEFTNSQSKSLNDYSRYLSDMSGLVAQLTQVGAVPVISSELGNTRGANGSAAKELKSLSDRLGVPFFNLATYGAKFFDSYVGFMVGVHEGTRTAWWVVDALKPFIDALPRQRQSMKLYAKNPNFAMGAIKDLLYEKGDHVSRAQRFTGLAIGHYALGAGVEANFDRLNQIGAYAFHKIDDQNLRLENGDAVALTAEYVLIEAILPSTARNISSLILKLSDPTLTVYVRNFLTGAYEGKARYLGFKIAAPQAGLAAGAVYTSNEAALPGNLTVSYIGANLAAGWVHMVPTAPTSTTNNRGAGVLTKVSGAGPAIINYSLVEQTGEQSWYDQLYKPEGDWTALVGTAGVWTLDSKKHVSYDEVHILVYKAGGVTLSSVSLEGIGIEHKVRPSKPLPAYPSGAELIAETLMGNAAQLNTWTKSSGAVVTAVPEEGANALPVNVTDGVARLPVGESVAKQINFAADSDQTRTLQVRVWAKNYVPIHQGGAIGTSPIRSDTFDAALCDVTVSNADGSQPVTVKTHFGPVFGERILEFEVPILVNALLVKVASSDKTLDSARISARLV